MAKPNNIMYLEQLFSREAHELYQDEIMLGEAFDGFARSASNPLLTELFEMGGRESVALASNIKAHLVGDHAKGRRPAFRSILEEGQVRATSLGDHHLVDAELIASMRRLLGYQIAGYENVAGFAGMLREDAMEGVLVAALEQKRRLSEQLTQVALHQVHWRANWWAPEHSSGWDRVKAAFRRDWGQTKAHMGAAPPLPDGEQKAGDTLAQITGRQEPGVAVADGFEAHEPAFRYGYVAAQHYRDRNWDPELEGELRANYGGLWDNARDNIRAGWDYARPQHEEHTASGLRAYDTPAT